jgi:hypothetical protein
MPEKVLVRVLKHYQDGNRFPLIKEAEYVKGDPPSSSKRAVSGIVYLNTCPTQPF